ncbi:hypothetical protein RBB79_05775 [Tunturiibacter empetritectus]|uniref:Uncharacterized protein n=1 Tax=Tunturiibacter lichenicola TaxID=2051959 RepID=A0A852VFL2_9BACT|nr:hypothetical protein [Edaphobacter lichenicola]NYF89035.1 hypothetical protein [Edaphobacter lichenicola]
MKGDVARQVVLHRRDHAGAEPGCWIGWLKERRQHASKRQYQGKDRSSLMRENEHEAEDCGQSEKPELTVLTTAEKLVEGPEVFRHWHDGYQKRCEEYENLTE